MKWKCPGPIWGEQQVRVLRFPRLVSKVNPTRPLRGISAVATINDKANITSLWTSRSSAPPALASAVPFFPSWVFHFSQTELHRQPTIGGRLSQAEPCLCALRHHNIRLDEVLETRSDWSRSCLDCWCPPHGPETEAGFLKTKPPLSKNGSVPSTGPIWTPLNSLKLPGLFRPRSVSCHGFFPFVAR